MIEGIFPGPKFIDRFFVNELQAPYCPYSCYLPSWHKVEEVTYLEVLSFEWELRVFLALFWVPVVNSLYIEKNTV